MKNPKQTIDKRFSFTNRFLSGVIIALALTFTAFEWTTEKTEIIIPTPTIGEPPEIMPPLRFRVEKLEKPKPKSNSDEIKLVEELTKPDPKPEPEPDPEPAPEIPSGNIDIDLNEFGMGEENFEDPNKIYTSVQVFAHYNSCAELSGSVLEECSKNEIMELVRNNFIISPQLRDAGGLQKTFVTFVIDTEGNITNVEAIRASSKAMEKCAVKTIESLPKMNPAQQQGRSVLLRMTIPIKLKF